MDQGPITKGCSREWQPKNKIKFFARGKERSFEAGPLILAVLLRAGANAERKIKRTGLDQAGCQEDNCQHHEYDPKGAGDYVREVQSGNNQRDDDANQAVGVAHVLFHSRKSLMRKCGFELKPKINRPWSTKW